MDVDMDANAEEVAAKICETIIFPADAIVPKEYADADSHAESEVDFIELDPMTSLNVSQQISEAGRNTTNNFDNKTRGGSKSVNVNNTHESEQATEDDEQLNRQENDVITEDTAADYDEIVDEEQREDFDIICDAVREEQSERQNALEVEEEEENGEEEEVENENDEIITADIPVPNIVERTAARKQESVNENQCRVCTTTEDLVSLFGKIDNSTPADLLMTICPNVFIAAKDYMPQFICNNCLDNVTIAVQMKCQLETTESELRKKLSRSKNKIRRPRGYVVIDAPDSDPQSEDDEPNDDVEFKVSEEEVSSAESDSEDSDISGKRKRTSRGAGGQRGRRKGQIPMGNATKPIKRELDTGTDDNINNDNGPSRRKRTLNNSTVQQDDDLTCEVCNKQFKMRRAFQTHRSKHIGCNDCDRIFKNRTELQRHISQNHDQSKNLYECKKCRRAYQSKSKLRQHMNEQCGSKSIRKTDYQSLGMGTDLFKSVAPLTTTYWSDSFSD